MWVDRHVIYAFCLSLLLLTGAVIYVGLQVTQGMPRLDTLNPWVTVRPTATGVGPTDGPLRPGAVAPDFSLRSLDGRPYRLSRTVAAHGLTMVLFLPAEGEAVAAALSQVAAAQEALAAIGDPGLLLVCDTSAERLNLLAAEHDLWPPLLLDADGHVRGQLYALPPVPCCLVVDRNRRIVWLQRACDPGAGLETFVRLGGRTPAQAT